MLLPSANPARNAMRHARAAHIRKAKKTEKRINIINMDARRPESLSPEQAGGAAVVPIIHTYLLREALSMIVTYFSREINRTVLVWGGNPLR